jgi:uncharacterized protein
MKNPVKMLVVSDSHGNTAALQGIIDTEKPFDIMVHCGDGVLDLSRVKIPASANVIGVQGNVDQFHGADRSAIEFFEAGSFRVMATHGNIHRVNESFSGLIEAARASGCNIVLFGHTHVKHISGESPVLFNPGPASNGSYGVVIVGSTIECRHGRREA